MSSSIVLPGQIIFGDVSIEAPNGIGLRMVSFEDLAGLFSESDFEDYVTQIAGEFDSSLTVIQGMENSLWKIIYRLKRSVSEKKQVGFQEELSGLFRLAGNDSSSLVLIPHVKEIVGDPKYPSQGMILLDKDDPFIILSLPYRTDNASLSKYLMELRRLERANGCFFGIVSDKYFLKEDPFYPSIFLQNQLSAFEEAFGYKRNI